MSVIQGGLIVIPNGQASSFVGFARQQKTQTIVQTVGALGGTATISGPGAGLLRVLMGVATDTVDSTTARAISCVLNPGAFPLGTNATQFILFNTNQSPILGPGETLDITNNSAVAVQLSYSYYDMPDTGITLLRTRFTNIPVTIVPAPAAGLWRRVALIASNQGTTSRPITASGVPYNCDTAPARWGLFLGASLLGFNSATISMSGNPAPIPGLAALTITAASGDLKIATFAPVATAQNTYIGAYETFSD